MSANPARASVNVNVDPALLSRLAARVGANSFLTVHRLIDLSRSGLADAAVAEFKVSQALASAQADAAAEVQGCRFRPQPNIIVSLRLRDNPLGDAGTKAAAQALLLRAPLNLRCLTLSNVGTGDVGTAALVAALAGATTQVTLVSLDLSDNQLTAASGPALASLLAAPTQRLEELRLSRNGCTNNTLTLAPAL